jgi:hypothetical protein
MGNIVSLNVGCCRRRNLLKFKIDTTEEDVPGKNDSLTRKINLNEGSMSKRKTKG